MQQNLLAKLLRFHRSKRGDSMLQTTASVAAASILAGTTAPAVGRFMDQAKATRATGEVKTVATAVNMLINDLGKSTLPRSPDDTRPLALLVSDGDAPTAEGKDGASWNLPTSDEGVGLINDYLYTNSVAFPAKLSAVQGRGWCGPYLASPLESDPWGNRYVISVGLYGRRESAVAAVVCAGPDGVIEVPYGLSRADMTSDHGDDIYFPLE